MIVRDLITLLQGCPANSTVYMLHTTKDKEGMGMTHKYHRSSTVLLEYVTEPKPGKNPDLVGLTPTVLITVDD